MKAGMKCRISIRLTVRGIPATEWFGTDSAVADQLFFDQIRASAQYNENIAEAVRVNTMQILPHIWIIYSTSSS